MTTLAQSPHVDDEVLLRRACNELTAAEEAEVSAHLACCEPCREVWRAVESVRRAAVEFDPGAVAPAERRFSRERPSRRRRIPRRWRLGGLAAAAALAAFVVWVNGPYGPTPAPDPVVRSVSQGAPEPLSPAEASRVRQPELSWREVEGAAAYTVELLDGRGEPLWSSDRVAGNAAAWPASVEPRPGRYYWRVTAHFEGGEEPISSPLISFHLIAE